MKVGGDLHDPLEMRAERKGRPQQVVSYRVGGKTGGSDFYKGRKRQRSNG